MPRRQAANASKPTRRGRKITSSARKAIDKLSPNPRSYVVARAEGGTVRSSAREAGVSRRMGHKYERDADVQAAYRELIRSAIPAPHLVKLIKGGCNATMPVYDAKGRKKKDKPDGRTRKPYIDMASEHGGYFKKETQNSAVLISVQVQHVGQGQAPSVQRAKPIIEASAEAERTPGTLQRLTS